MYIYIRSKKFQKKNSKKKKFQKKIITKKKLFTGEGRTDKNVVLNLKQQKKKKKEIFDPKKSLKNKNFEKKFFFIG